MVLENKPYVFELIWIESNNNKMDSSIMHFSGVEKFQNVLLLGSCIDYDNEKMLNWTYMFWISEEMFH